ncbi:MAG: hypothetical protein ACK6D4_23185, partial [Planctomyces sp.]
MLVVPGREHSALADGESPRIVRKAGAPVVPERKVESSDAHPGSFIIAYQNSKSDCEFSGYSHSLKQSYLITIKSLPLFGAVFT